MPLGARDANHIRIRQSVMGNPFALKDTEIKIVLKTKMKN
jgi:hypothetical protein